MLKVGEKSGFSILAGRGGKARGGGGRGLDASLIRHHEIQQKSCIFRLAGYNIRVVCFAFRVSGGEQGMKYSEFRRWLRRHGVEIKPGKGSHFRLTLNGKISSFPDHGSKEIGKGLLERIKKQLGLK